MNLTNVATTVIGPPAYRALDRDGKDQGHTPLGEPDDVQEMEILMGQGIVWRTEERQRAPAHLWPAAIRDWHALLIELVNLKSDRPLVADWLNRAGYAARLARMAPKGRRTLATPPMDPMPESVLPLLDPHDAFLWGPLPRLPYREFQKRRVINFYDATPSILRAAPPKETMVPCVVWDAEFSAEYVTDQILKWLQPWQRAFNWAMDSEKFDPTKFQNYARRARLYERAKSRNSDEAMKRAMETGFMLAVGAPKDVPPDFLKTLLLGLGSQEPLRGGFQIDEQGRPRCVVVAETPMIALTITVLLDRAFTERGGGICKYKPCGERFQRRTANQEFCRRPRPCQKRWNIDLLRAKEKLVKEAQEKARRENDWKWIAAHATRELRKLYPNEPKKNMTITPEWAKERLTR